MQLIYTCQYSSDLLISWTSFLWMLSFLFSFQSSYIWKMSHIELIMFLFFINLSDRKKCDWRNHVDVITFKLRSLAHWIFLHSYAYILCRIKEQSISLKNHYYAYLGQPKKKLTEEQLLRKEPSFFKQNYLFIIINKINTMLGLDTWPHPHKLIRIVQYFSGVLFVPHFLVWIYLLVSCCC